MKIITPIKCNNIAEIEKTLTENDFNKCDIIEIWLDQIDDVQNLGPILQKAGPKWSVEFLAVCKTEDEKGEFKGTQAVKKERLLTFLQQGGTFIDCDIRCTPKDVLKDLPSEKLWLSYHDFIGVPQNLPEIFALMSHFNPRVYKFALTTDHPLQLNAFLEFTNTFPQDLPGIFTTMGRLGSTGRDQLKTLSYAGFYALDEASKTASGQRTLAEL